MKLADVQGLVTSQHEENVHLDYKACASVGKTDGKKDEISKDVSSFANSDGGIIIYGIKEYDEPAKKHLPERIDDGFDPADISREWLENVITSRIQPKINGLIIHPIALPTNKVIYSVEIPKSTTAHQASDKRYYKRHNFKAEPMEDYEVRDTMNRSQLPVLEPQFTPRLLPDSTGTLHEYELRINLLNNGSLVIKDFLLTFGMPEEMLRTHDGYLKPPIHQKVVRNGVAAQYLMLSYAKPDNQTVIFPQQEYVLIPSAPQRCCVYRVNDQILDGYIDRGFDLMWKLFADNMPLKEGAIPLKTMCNF